MRSVVQCGRPVACVCPGGQDDASMPDHLDRYPKGVTFCSRTPRIRRRCLFEGSEALKVGRQPGAAHARDRRAPMSSLVRPA